MPPSFENYFVVIHRSQGKIIGADYFENVCLEIREHVLNITVLEASVYRLYMVGNEFSGFSTPIRRGVIRNDDFTYNLDCEFIYCHDIKSLHRSLELIGALQQFCQWINSKLTKMTK